MKDDHLDMSPRAVAARLDTMRALYDLMKYLGKFRPATDEQGPVEPETTRHRSGR